MAGTRNCTWPARRRGSGWKSGSGLGKNSCYTWARAGADLFGEKGLLRVRVKTQTPPRKTGEGVGADAPPGWVGHVPSAEGLGGRKG